MNKNYLDFYTDYLMVTFGYATATGLSALLDGTVSHDSITRFLSKRDYTSKELWAQAGEAGGSGGRDGGWGVDSG